MIRVLIADDHQIVREGLKQILAETSDIAAVGEASNAGEVLTQVLKNDYDVVLLDISMPGRSGLEILRELKSAKAGLKILMLSMHPEEHYAVRALKAGASGYLTKDRAPEELIEAIRRVSLGGKYISATLAEKLAFYLEEDSEKPPHERLSDREYEVMRMLASGKTVKEIAQELSLSVKTISTHRTRLLRKMNMKTNAQLASYAIQNKLVE